MINRPDDYQQKLYCEIFNHQNEKQRLKVVIDEINDKLSIAQKELAEYQEPTMAVNTLCEVAGFGKRYFSHKEAVGCFFFNDGRTSNTNGNYMLLGPCTQFKIIEEPGLPWKDIDDNVPEAVLYLVRRGNRADLTVYTQHLLTGKNLKYIDRPAEYLIIKEKS